MAGTTPLPSFDPLASVQALTDPAAVEFIATQLNDSTLNQNRAQGALRCQDLSEAIIDIVIEDGAQGAAVLEVHITDPWWQLLTRYGNNPAFIDVDDSGLLIPVDVNFPQGTDCWWRLEACEPDLDPSTPIVLTFEDRSVALMRDLGGPKVAGNNQTRAAFIYSCVRPVPGLRFVCPALSQPAGSVGGDLTQGQINAQVNPVPASAKNPKAPTARKNPAKKPGFPSGPTGGHQNAGSGWGLSPGVISVLNPPTNVPDTTAGDPFGILSVIPSGIL